MIDARMLMARHNHWSEPPTAEASGAGYLESRVKLLVQLALDMHTLMPLIDLPTEKDVSEISISASCREDASLYSLRIRLKEHGLLREGCACERRVGNEGS